MLDISRRSHALGNWEDGDLPASNETSRPSTGMSHAGPRLRQLREAKGLKLTHVAQSAGVTKGFLSLVERGRSSVTVPVLMRICDVVGITIGSLFEYPSSDLIHSDEGAPLEMGGVGLQEFLLTPAKERFVQIMRTIAFPGGGSGGAYTLDTETVFVFVVRGTLQIAVDGEKHELHAGDSMTFSAHCAHEWGNPTDEESEYLWALAPPLESRLHALPGDGVVHS